MRSEMTDGMGILQQRIYEEIAGIFAGKDLTHEQIAALMDDRKEAVVMIMRLITADRKRVALEARIDELEKQNSHYSMKGGFVLLYEEDGNNVYLGDRITKLKQELEKL